MMLDMQALKDCPVHVTLEENAEQLGVAVVGVTLSGMVRAEIEIMQGDGVYFCNGEATCAAQIECSRCLEPYPVNLRGDIEFSIQEVADETQVRRDEIPDTELLVPLHAAAVDITTPVREALVLEIPLKPLCREECRGLCPRCGINRNLERCQCVTGETDTRWDALRDLLQNRPHQDN
jgi:uncharacterized protein